MDDDVMFFSMVHRNPTTSHKESLSEAPNLIRKMQIFSICSRCPLSTSHDPYITEPPPTILSHASRPKPIREETNGFKAQALCFYLLVLPLLASATGEWQPVNISDPHVKEIGEFAVAEYNKSSNATLKFMGVVNGETQVIDGANYRLDLEAKDGSVTSLTKNYYEAVVLEKAWKEFRNLTSFKQLLTTHNRP